MEVATGEDLADLETVLASAEIFARDEDPQKWIPGYAAHPGAVTLDHLQNRGFLVALGSVGKAGIGFVSGANEYFVVTAEEAARWRLPETSLRPALIRARQIPGLQITTADGEAQD